MTEATFTAGPWECNGSHVYAPDGAIIAVVHNPGSTQSDYPLVANRDLISAAPDLLDALERLLLEHEGTGKRHPSQYAWGQARAAISKATGAAS